MRWWSRTTTASSGPVSQAGGWPDSIPRAAPRGPGRFATTRDSGSPRHRGSTSSPPAKAASGWWDSGRCAGWVAAAAGLARFDGSSWIDTGGPWSTWGASVADGPDGTVWVAVGDSGDGAVTVAHFDGQSWVSYGPSDGLPGPNASGYAVAHAVPTNARVYVGPGGGSSRHPHRH